MMTKWCTALIMTTGLMLLFVGTGTSNAQGREAYGLVTSIQFLGDSNGITRMQQLGNGVVRIGIAWSDVQQTQGGSFDFSYYQAMLDSARANGMQIYANLGQPPSWAAPCLPNCAPYDFNAWYAYVHATVSWAYGRYGDAITFGVWNEPNDPTFLQDDCSCQYWNLASTALQARNDLGSGARFGIADSTTVTAYNGWLDGIIGGLRRQGFMRASDAVAIHWYPGDAGFGDVAPVMGYVAQRYGQEVWLTESGTTTPTSDQDQVNAISHLITSFQGRGSTPGGNQWTRFFYYRLYDNNPNNNTESLTRSDWSPRPGFYTYQSFVPGNGGGSGETDVPGGTILYPGNSISSPSGEFVLTYQSDGNFVLYDNGAPVWAINCWPTCNSTGFEGNSFYPAGYATMQTDGNLVVYNASNAPDWHTYTYGNPGAYLAIKDDGSLVVYASDHTTVLWHR